MIAAPGTLDIKALSSLALEVEAYDLQTSLSEFCKAAWHVLEPNVPICWGWAMDAICEHLEAVTDGRIKRLLINCPPGMAKSLVTSVFWPAWEWARYKYANDKRVYQTRSMRFISTSYEIDLAIRDSVRCRDLITSDWYQARWPLKLRGDKNEKKMFANDETGFRAARAFTSMTGVRGDRVVIDDPHSVKQATSVVELLSAEQTFRESLPSRVNNKNSAIVIIMQRLHTRDVSGIILSDKLDYVHLCLPMEFEPERKCTTVIGFTDPRTERGQLLFPERFDAKQVAELKSTLREYATAGQLQQAPTPRGGGMFKTKYIKHWPAERQLPYFDYVVQSYDGAYTEKTANDPCAGTVWGVFEHDKRYKVMLIDAWDLHLNYAAFRTKLIKDYKAIYGQDAKDTYNRPGRRADIVIVENKASGISVIQDLQRANIPAIAYNPGKADKYARAEIVLPLYELDLVYVIESKLEPGQPVTWARPFVEQLGKFGPGVTEHDDLTDTFTQAMIYLRDQGKLTLPGYESDEEITKDYSKKYSNPYAQ